MANPERCKMNHIEMMQLAERVARQSVCKRAQVGAVVRYTKWQGCVGDVWTAAQGYNKRPCGGECEGAGGRTLPDVMHAEAMAIEAALGAVECEFLPDGVDEGGMFDSALYVTRQPCIKCAELIVDAGIHAVYYRDADDKTDGLEYLQSRGVHVDSCWITGRVAESWAERNGVAG